MKKEVRGKNNKHIMVGIIIFGVILAVLLGYFSFKCINNKKEHNEEITKSNNQNEKQLTEEDNDKELNIKNKNIEVKDGYTFIKKDVKYSGSDKNCPLTYDVIVNIPIIKSNYTSGIINNFNQTLLDFTSYNDIENEYTSYCGQSVYNYNYTILNNILYLVTKADGFCNGTCGANYEKRIFYDIINDKELTTREALIASGYNETELLNYTDDQLESDQTKITIETNKITFEILK